MNCIKCGLPGEFYPKKQKKGWCKKCIHKENYQKRIAKLGKEGYRASTRAWKATAGAKAKSSVWNASYRQRLKRQVVDFYGGKCKCCGITELAFLTVDHINNDGHIHRKDVAGSRLLNWLIRNGYPHGFQILCFNCNLAKAHFGGVCPHERTHDVASIQ